MYAPSRRQRPRGPQSGFTLLEILIVIALIATISAALLPNVGGGFSSGIRNAARVLGADLRYASQRAVATGELHRWTLDLDRQSYRIERRAELGAEETRGLPTHAELLELSPPLPEWEYRPVENRSGEWHWLDEEDVEITSVQIGEFEHDEGQVSIHFGSDGGADPAEIRLIDGSERRVELRILAFTGEVRVVEDPEGS